MEERKDLPQDCRPALRVADASVDVDQLARMELELYYNHLNLMLFGRHTTADELFAEVVAAIERVKVSAETKGFLRGRAELYAQALYHTGS